MIERAILALVLGDLTNAATRIGATLVVTILLALAFTISSLSAVLGSIAPSQAGPATQTETIPPDQLALMQAVSAGSTCGLPWQILAAVARVESVFGQNMATSSAGAIGYGQFLPQTWAQYGNGGNPYDYRDALPAMERYLCAHGAGQNMRAALWAYNHADWYVNDVLALAVRYGYLAPGSIQAQALSLALAQQGKPYKWGGQDPATSFDCSGLVYWAYGQVGVRLPRTAQQQYDATERVQPDELQPGDLVFFAQTYPSQYEWITHVGIYTGEGMMINAPVEGKPISVMPVFTGFWGSHYAGAGRVRQQAVPSRSWVRPVPTRHQVPAPGTNQANQLNNSFGAYVTLMPRLRHAYASRSTIVSPGVWLPAVTGTGAGPAGGQREPKHTANNAGVSSGHVVDHRSYRWDSLV